MPSQRHRWRLKVFLGPELLPSVERLFHLSKSLVLDTWDLKYLEIKLRLDGRNCRRSPGGVHHDHRTSERRNR